MTSDHPKPSTAAADKFAFRKLGANLYRLYRPGDKPSKPSGVYYALLKRGGKQFRRSLKTVIASWPNAA